MKLFDKIFKRRSVSGTLAADVGPASIVGSAATVSVGNEYQATRIATAYRCVDILSAGVAVLPFRKKRLNRAENYFVDVDGKTDRTNYLIGVRPNKHMTAFEMIRGAVTQMVLLGNAYIVPRMDERGQLSELILCSPRSVAHDTYSDLYIISDPMNGISGTYTADQIIHLRNMSLDGGRSGISTVSYAAQALGIQATADKETKGLFATGGRLKGIVHNNSSVRGFGEYQDIELGKVAKTIQKEFENGTDIFYMPGDTQFTSISMTAVDMQLLEHKKFGVTEICRFFGVHPDKVFAQQSNNYKASEMSQVSFLTDTLIPILRKIENEFRAKLVPPALADDFRFEFDTTAIYTTDLTTEASYMEKTISTGVMTINEWRRKKGLKPVQGGDTTLVSCNVAPIAERQKEI
jgi:phage portal protein, HK97 family